jgi:tetratricopeptide (TPR) repeat protein
MSKRAEGNAHVAAGRWGLAHESYTRALAEGEPDAHLILGNRAYVCMKMDDAAGALSDAEESLERGPEGWAKGLYRLAQALDMCGRRDEALTHAAEASR